MGRSSLRSWLYRIATNVALTAIDGRGRSAVPLEDRAAAGARRRALREIVNRYTSALDQGDVDATVELPAEDVTWAMPPWAEWYGGIEDVRVFLADKPMTQAWRHVPVQVNGPLAAGCYMREEDGVFRPYVIDVIGLRGDASRR